MRSIWTVARRELKGLFDQPTGYILIVIFIVVNNFLYFRQAYLFGVASLRPMLQLLPWMFLFLVPAVTMRSLAEDKRGGTLEIVLAQPLTELGYLLGKYVGQVLFIWCALALTLAVPLGLSLGADLHVGVVIAQYVGSALLVAGLAGVGVWASSLTKNQITAFIIAVAVMFALVLIGLDPLLLGLPPSLSALAARLGVLPHFGDIARGVIDLRDVVYFLTLGAIFLALAYGALMRRKLSPKGDAIRRLRWGVAIVVVGCVVINLFGRQIGGRLDLTPGNAYTLSDATHDIVRNLDDLVTIKLFASEELPAEVALLRRDIDDLLRDYRSAAGGNIRLVVQDPSEDPEVESEARSLGIPPVQFNVVGESQFSVRDGYLGLAVQYADQHETVPFIRRTEDLEYRLTSFIRGMVDTTRAAVGFFVDPSESRMPNSSFNTLRQQLTRTYDVRSLSLTSDSIFDDDVAVAVLIGAPDSLPAAQREQFAAFLARGGSALIGASGMSLGQQQFAMGRDVVWNAILEPYGVSIRSDMAYDLIANERVRIPTQFGIQLLRPYPLWLRTVSTRASVVNQGLDGVFLPWASTIDTSGVIAEGVVTPLLTTTEAGGVQADAVMLDPSRDFPQADLGPRVLAVQVNPLAVEAEPTGPTGRIVLVGNSSFLQDRFAQANQANLAFGLNAVDWLAQDEALISIRAKNRTPPTLTFSSEAMSTIVRYFNVFGIPILVIIAGVMRLLKRRQRTRLRYVSTVAKGATP